MYPSHSRAEFEKPLPEAQLRQLLRPHLRRVGELHEDIGDVLEDAVTSLMAAGLAKENERPATIPSTFTHRYYKITEFATEYGGVSERRDLAASDEADLVSSEVIIGKPTCGHAECKDEAHKGAEIMHTVVIDVDLPVGVLPSSTAGHFHLYIDQPMSWRAYKRLLKALRRAGIIEKGYYEMSKRRHGSHLRVPWQKKGEPTSYGEIGDWLS